MKNDNLMKYLIPIAVFILWGSLYVVAKPAMEHIPPLTLLTLRLSVAAAVIALILKKKHGRIQGLKKAHIPRFIAIGTLGYGAGLACLQISNHLLEASLSSLLNSLCPIAMIAIAAVVLHERIDALKIAGIAFAIAGVYIIVGIGGSSGSISGIVIACVSVLLWSLGSVLIRAVSPDYGPVTTTLYGILFSLPVLTVSSAVELAGTPAHFSLTVCLQVLYLGVFATALGNVLWAVALSKASAGTCSMFYPVQALTSSIMGIVFLGEAVTQSFVIGAVVISAGILVAVYSDHRSEARLKNGVFRKPAEITAK